MEPAWMQKISNASVCNFFYAWFVVYAVFFAFAIVSVIGIFLTVKKFGALEISLSVQSVLMTLLAASFMMFHYMVCDRALLPAGKAAGAAAEEAKAKANPLY